MHLDAADLRAGKVLLYVDPEDAVVLNDGEHTAKVPHNAGLSAVVDIAEEDVVAPHMLFVPALVGGLEDAVPLGLGAVLCLLLQPLVVILRLQDLAKRDAGALGLCDLAVFDHPAL